MGGVVNNLLGRRWEAGAGRGRWQKKGGRKMGDRGRVAAPPGKRQKNGGRKLGTEWSGGVLGFEVGGASRCIAG